MLKGNNYAFLQKRRALILLEIVRLNGAAAIEISFLYLSREEENNQGEGFFSTFGNVLFVMNDAWPVSYCGAEINVAITLQYINCSHS